MMTPPVLETLSFTPKVKAGVLQDGRPIRLNLGGSGEGFVDSRIEGFVSVDLREVPETDVLCNVRDLSIFETNSVETIFASQILEHFPIAETVTVLKEWRRVLKPQGRIYVSVPDFDVAVKLYLQTGLTRWLTYHLWGDQKHPLNYHYTGFTAASLARDLLEAGFSDIKRTVQFPFDVKGGAVNRDNKLGLLISLNMEAQK